VSADRAKRRIERDPKFAVVYYDKESRHAEQKYGVDSSQALNLRQEYAVALHRIGQSKRAEAELAAVMSRREPGLDVDDDFIWYAMTWHARVLNHLGRFDEAEREWRHLAESCDRLLGPSHRDAVDVHEEHAVTLARLGQVAEALAEMTTVVERRVAAGGPDDIATLTSRTSQAVYLDNLDRRADSEAAWRGLAEAKGRVLGSDHLETIAAHERLAVSLYAQRRLLEAAAEYRDVSALRAARQGADHPDTQRARDWHAVIERELADPDRASAD
jgi:tetratricopeptide (TPR) repeat protein